MVDYFWFSVLVAANGLLLFILTVNVSRIRMKNKISLGDGDNKPLLEAIRTHGNNVEQFPVYALVILALTFMGASSTLLAGLVIAYTLSRITHAYGMLNSHFTSRRIGMAVTYLLQLVAPITVCVYLAG
jgi:uncharacterized membrane protein YecN with MAPEG domain